MIIYYSFVFCGIMLAMYLEKIKQKKLSNKKMILWILILVLSILSGFRGYDVGTDTKHYTRIFNFIYYGGTSSLEFGFVYSTEFLMNIFKDVQYLFFIYAFFTNAFIIHRLWDFKNVASFSFMCFLYIGIFFPESMNILRQYLALAIVFWGTRYLDRMQYLKYSFIVVFSAFFHFSSLISFLLLPIHYYFSSKLTRMKVIICVVGILVTPVMIYFLYIIQNHYSGYMVAPEEGFSLLILMRVLGILFFFIIHICSRTFLCNFSNEKNKLKYIPYIYTLGVILSTSGVFFPYVGRIALIFMLFEIIFVSMIVKNEKLPIYKIAYIFLTGYFMIYKLSILRETGIMPYHMFFG